MFKLNVLREPGDYTKITGWIGHIFFIIYTAFCAFYYLERTVAFDGAFYCYKMIHYQSMNVENGRWGIAYSQWLPLMAVWLKCSLKTILILYSISFALWNYFFFIVILKYYKQFRIALAYVFSLVLFYRYSFFYPVSEIHSTIGPLFLALAATSCFITSNQEGKTKEVLLNFTLLLLTVYWMAQIHILSVVPLCFLFAYIIIDKKVSLQKNLIVYAGLALCILFILYKIAIIPKDSYEGSKMIGLKEFTIVLSSAESLESYHFLKAFFAQNYVLNLLFLGISLAYLFYKKNYLKTLLILLSFFGMITLVLAYFTKTDAPLNYQNYYCLLGVIVALPLAYDLAPVFSKRIFIITCFIILLFNFYKIIKSGLIYQDRTRYIERSINNFSNYKESKFTVCAWNFDWSVVWGDWDFPFESLIISSLNDPKSTRTFHSIIDIHQFDFCTLKDPKCFIGITYLPNWFRINSDFIKCDYFNLKDGFYRKVNSRQDESFADSLFNSENLKIITQDSYSLLRNNKRQIEISLENKTNILFSSSITEIKKIWLSYHLYSEKGDLLVAEGDRSIIEMDIPANSTIKNGLSLNLKDVARGEYILEIDIVHEGKRWFGTNKRTKLTIY